jgi:hypothetical protein
VPRGVQVVQATAGAGDERVVRPPQFAQPVVRRQQVPLGVARLLLPQTVLAKMLQGVGHGGRLLAVVPRARREKVEHRRPPPDSVGRAYFSAQTEAPAYITHIRPAA